MIPITTPINDIVIVDTSGERLHFACQVVSEKPLGCNASTLRKYIANELTRLVYSGVNKICAEELSECIERRLSIPQKIEIIGLTAR